MSRPGDKTLRVHKDFRRLVQAALDAGWSWRRTGGGHVRLEPPDGTRGVTLPSTPNKASSSKRKLAGDLRRAGLDV